MSALSPVHTIGDQVSEALHLHRSIDRPGGAPPLRTVIAIAERMPELGRRFYETGPAYGIAQLQAFLGAQVAAGAVRLSVVAPGDVDGVDFGSGLLLPVELLRVDRASRPGHIEADCEAEDARACPRVDGHDEPTVG